MQKSGRMTLVLPCADAIRLPHEATSTASLPHDTRSLSRGHVDGVEATRHRADVSS